MPARTGRTLTLVALILFTGSAALAADVTPPAEVGGLLVDRSGADLVLTWSPVTTDAAGNAESAVTYRIYRGTTPSFEPDRSGGTNLVGTSSTTSFTDVGAGAGGPDGDYLVSAVDVALNESAVEPSTVTTPAVLSGTYTDTGVDLTWTAASPSDQVARYLVYYGTSSHTYDAVKDVGLATATFMSGLSSNVNYYFAVVAVDVHGNASPYSNEHIDCVAGRITLRVHDDDGLCWLGGGQHCPPRPGTVQRSDGFQLMVPVTFPQGSWSRVTMKFTMDSRLCTPGQNGTTDKCGSTNPGGTWNPCGDPWDRGALTFLVLDGCIAGGGSCATNDNLELIRAITPFGTDAPPPAGTGVVPPRTVQLDVTPYAPLLQGPRYVGAEIGNYATAGWHVTTEFVFSKRPEEASTKTPAAGIKVVGYGGTPMPTRSVTIPPTATKVVGRLFTTGHGGSQYCDGGSNDGGACTSSSQCPGGSCQNCDEFCHRTNRILKDGAPVYTVVPWRECCVPKYPGDPFCQGCTAWNACGFPSCTFDRAGWCPGYLACTSDGNCDQDIDLTAQFPPGGTYNVGYDVLVQRGSWSVSLVLYWY